MGFYFGHRAVFVCHERTITYPFYAREGSLELGDY